MLEKLGDSLLEHMTAQILHTIVPFSPCANAQGDLVYKQAYSPKKQAAFENSY